MKDLSKKEIVFDATDFNVDSIRQIENMIINLLKSIKGEMPLIGLVQRIVSCLDKYYVTKENSSQKKFLLEKQNQ